MLLRLAQNELAPWIKEGHLEDALFLAAARTRMEWIGKEEREGLPFNVDEFLRRARMTGQ